jgi:hypothetical protein
MCRRLRDALLALGIVLSASSARARVVYSGRVYTARGHSWHQLRVIQFSDGKTTALTDSPRSRHPWALLIAPVANSQARNFACALTNAEKTSIRLKLPSTKRTYGVFFGHPFTLLVAP